MLIRLCQLALALLVMPVSVMAAQEAPAAPPIKAHSKRIQILDGDDTLQGELVPELNPDIYVYHPTGKPKTVSFITDLERIDILVEPGQSYDFSILLDGQECRQRLAPIGPNSARYHGPDTDGAGDVLPFTLGENNAIHLQGRLNDSPPLDLIFDTGASICVLSEEGRNQGALRRNGTDNRLEVAGIVIENTPVAFIDYRGSLKADGVQGWPATENLVHGL